METTTMTKTEKMHNVYLDYCEAKDKLYKACIDAIEGELFRNSATLWVSDEAQAMFKTDVTRVFHQPTYPYALMCQRDNQPEAISLYEMPIEDLTAIAMILTGYKLKFHQWLGR